jgi:hypothetical protein
MGVLGVPPVRLQEDERISVTTSQRKARCLRGGTIDLTLVALFAGAIFRISVAHPSVSESIVGMEGVFTPIALASLVDEH